MSDVTGRAQDVPTVGTGAAFGDAYLAGVGAGLVAADATWNPVAARVEPDAAGAPATTRSTASTATSTPRRASRLDALARLQDAAPDA